MNGALRIAMLVPPAGLIPLGLVFLAPFTRPVPVLVTVARRATGRAAGTGR